MKKSTIKNFVSIRSLEINISKTRIAIICYSSSILLMEHLDLKEQSKQISLDKNSKENLKAFQLPNEDDKNYLYVLGYIGLYSNFEIFMADFLKDLFVKFPKSLPEDTKLNLNEIDILTSKKQIKEFLIDKAAIAKSYTLKIWTDFLRDKYGIKIFKTKEEEDRFYLLDELRNSLIHSGGRINSKFKNFLYKRFKIKKGPKLNQHFTSDYKKFFDLLTKELETILGNLKKITL